MKDGKIIIGGHWGFAIFFFIPTLALGALMLYGGIKQRDWLTIAITAAWMVNYTWWLSICFLSITIRTDIKGNLEFRYLFPFSILRFTCNVGRIKGYFIEVPDDVEAHSSLKLCFQGFTGARSTLVLRDSHSEDELRRLASDLSAFGVSELPVGDRKLLPMPVSPRKLAALI